nr:M36 family metallopeptidase [Parvularcula dongshanensis]
MVQLLSAGNEAAATRAVGRAFGVDAPVKSRAEGRITYDRGDFYAEDPVASRVLVADTDGTLSLGYLVETWAKGSNELVNSLVDSRGQIVDKQLRTADDSYIAYAVSPAHGNPTVMQGSKADGKASPSGWLRTGTSQFDRSISGYNVHAYVDLDRNNKPDSSSKVTSWIFGIVPNLSKPATDTQNQKAAVQNLFYQLNDIHDKLYKYGFTETAGNFQYSNYGRGGVGGDFVRAEAVDGSGTNNANFATPISDGGTPRMQMYEWTYTNPGRNSSFDGDIVWHEYSHGLTWRMVGQMDGPVSGALGEGMSDAIAAIMTDDDRIGEWAMNRSDGIRTVRYRDFTKTLADFRGSSLHRDGEIWAAAMWRTWELFKQNGKSRDLLMSYIIDGLANTKPGPSYIDMRDGFLAGSRGTDDCLVWQAFAEFGMGEGAAMTRSGGRSSIKTSSKIPDGCSGTQTTSSPAGAAVAEFHVDGVKGKTDRWWIPTDVKVKSGGKALSGAKVVFKYSSGEMKDCTTGSDGRCSTSLGGRYRNDGNITVKVQSVNGSSASGASGVSIEKVAVNPYGSTTSSGAVVSEFKVDGIKGKPDRWWIPTDVKVTSGGKALSGAKVVFKYSSGEMKDCTTGSDGRCSTSLGGRYRNDGNITVKVQSVKGGTATAASGVSIEKVAVNPYGTSSASAVVTDFHVDGIKGKTDRWYVPTRVQVKLGGKLKSGLKVIFKYSTGHKLGCTTNWQGRCNTSLGGRYRNDSNITVKVVSVNGQPVKGASGVSIEKTAKNPYGGSSSNLKVATFSVDGVKGRTNRWWIPTYARVKSGGELASGVRVVFKYSTGDKSDCWTNSKGRCDTSLGQRRRWDDDVKVKVLSVGGKLAEAASGVKLTRTASNPY